MDKKIEKEYILLVEGKDEVRFFNVYLKHLGILEFKLLMLAGEINFRRNFHFLLPIPVSMQ